MRVTIIGTGNVGRALGSALRRGGHEVLFGSRHPDPLADDQAIIADAVAATAATILAVPVAAVASVIAAAGGFVNKILIDATNPLGIGERGLGLTKGFTTSGAEDIATLAPQAHVFKAFNQTGFENLGQADRYARRPLMLVAGDDPTTKPIVLGLVRDAGFEAIDLGGLHTSRLLEPLAMVWIELARKRGLGADFVLTLQHAQ